MSDQSALVDRLADLVGRARRAGADAADCLVAESRGLEVACRKGKRETLERAESLSLGLRVFVGERQASVSTGDLSDKTLNALVERAVQMAKAAPPDPDTVIAGASDLATEWPDLDLADPEEPSPERLSEIAEAAEAASLAIAGITNSEGAQASWSRSDIALATSAGFAGAYARTSVSCAATPIAEKDGQMERDYEWASATHLEDLKDAETVGREAAERTIRRLGARRIKSQQAPVVFEQRLAGGPVRSFASAVNAGAVARGVTYLKDSMGAQVLPKGVTLLDDPRRPRGHASKPFDGEGLAAEAFELVSDGVLQTWLLDLRSAKKLGLKSNGRASRGVGGSPSPSSTNLDLLPGEKAPDALIGEIENGFYVTELIGHGGDLATGDYSRGASGFWIENGEIAYPVNELTVAGNLKDMFLALTPASDLIRRGTVNAPTLSIDGMTLAGQ